MPSLVSRIVNSSFAAPAVFRPMKPLVRSILPADPTPPVWPTVDRRVEAPSNVSPSVRVSTSVRVGAAVAVPPAWTVPPLSTTGTAAMDGPGSTRPVPPRVPPAFTVTPAVPVALPVVLVTSRVPWLTVVPPV